MLNAQPNFENNIPGRNSRLLGTLLSQVESRNVTFQGDDFPVFWDRALGSTVWDVDGNAYIDFTSAFGVASIGHTHPAVVGAIKAQAERLIHGMGDVHPSAPKTLLCQKIALASGLDNAKVILSQNGGDAVESALKTALLYTGGAEVCAFNGGYHGMSYGALNVTSRTDFREPFREQMGSFVSHFPFGGSLHEIKSFLGGRNAGAVIVEPIQGRGGIVVPPDGWLGELKEICAKSNTLFIADEIFTGWGRTGSLFAATHDRVIPDIMCVGKAMGGGMPISACVATGDIMDCWPKSLGESIHTSTFLGNPLACAASLAAIDVILQEDLSHRASETGALAIKLLSEIVERNLTDLKSVRGRGLMLGIEFHEKEKCLRTVTTALQHGLFVLPAGDGSILEILPPLTITETELREGLTRLEVSLAEADKK